MAQICTYCFYENEIRTYNVNGKCDVCSSTDWIDEEELKLKLTSDEMIYLRNLLDRKGKALYKDLQGYMPDYERQRQEEVLEFVLNLKYKFVGFIRTHGI